MKGEITGENEERVGIYVTDNNGIEHGIEMEFDGEIKHHEQDGYPDSASERTFTQAEHGFQAYRYAKWHVYRERGYETLPGYENPDSIVGAMLALGATPETKIDQYFGDLLGQLRKHASGDDIQLPFEDAHRDDIIVYRKDIYVEPDPLDEEPPLADQFAEYFSDPSATLRKMTGEDAESLERLVEIIDGDAEPAEMLPEFEIEAVSDMHYLHSDGVNEQTHRGDSPRERDPDARIELMPIDPDVFASPKQLLFSHLGNQVRDCYLLMGCDPPAPFDQGGLGSYEGMKKQQLLEMYDEHFLADDEDRSPISGGLPL